ncbi:LacI family transcriptional regulator [Fulvivirgaceae bacterium PWU5]|uniref:LacI family transcriptional regulator n=1 Tax=Dawidia cretensis TaxID=2782350 RepID=A0AAP2DXX9_9BACT|nr:LacI family DNA-binding transcriptional regulator [Dawidia cretensis]MBT1707809.1 LacI family transcriptional regulator [Dawidia cretensis]
MKKEKATIHDIARKLNITASTVSRALKDHPRISAETKKAVQKTAQKLNYQPNHIAAALRNGKSKIIGIIVPTADRSFFSSVVRGIEEIANGSQYNVMICQTYDNYEKEVATVEALLNARVDGVIASHGKETQNFDHFLKVKERGIPLILFDRSNDELEVSSVVIDDFLGAYKATEHLIQQGCRRIAHFTNTRKISIFKERLRGYREALLDNNLSYDETLVIESNLQLEDGRNSTEQLLTLRERPDGIFSASALGIVGALQVLKENNIAVPDQVALVGFSNETYTSFTDPSLSTVEQHSMRIGNAAAEIFLEEVNADQKKFIPQKIVLKPELIIRQSSLRKK